MGQQFSRRARVKDSGRRRQGDRQRLEMGMGLCGSVTAFAFVMVVVAGVQGADSSILPSAIIFVVATVVFIIMAIKWRNLS